MEESSEPTQEEPIPVIVDLSRVVDIDFTAAIVRFFCSDGGDRFFELQTLRIQIIQ